MKIDENNTRTAGAAEPGAASGQSGAAAMGDITAAANARADIITAVDSPVTEWSAGEVRVAQTEVPAEVPVQLLVNGRLLAVLHCTPDHLDELAAGYLLGQGLIGAHAGIVTSRIDADGCSIRITLKQDIDVTQLVPRGHVSVFSGCGQPTGILPGTGESEASSRTGHDAGFDPAQVREALARLLRRGDLYGRTHGVHSAAIVSSQGEIMALREDIGRHNALDKALGWTAVRGLDPGRLFVVATGRISADAVVKISRFGIGLMVTRGVPTSMALALARDAGITLAGSMGPGRLRIYTHPERLGIAATT